MIYQRNLFDFVDIERREPLHSFSPPTVVYESLAETEYHKTKMPRYCEELIFPVPWSFSGRLMLRQEASKINAC